MSAAGELLSSATRELRTGGVPSPEHDARVLLALVTGRPLALLTGVEVDADAVRRFQDLIARRARREPLQHLTGTTGFRYLELQVGPGVFVPRPETEVMTGWVIDRLRAMERPAVVVDLCTGSGAIAKAIATEVAGTQVHAVEVSEDALVWAERNLSGTGVVLYDEDLALAVPHLNGTVDVVVANPPYVPLEAYASVAPEARDHDPTLALFSGADGLDAIRTLTLVAARLLRPGGLLAFEHAEVQGEAAPAVVTTSGRYGQVRDHPDLLGRPRFTTAVRLNPPARGDRDAAAGLAG